MDMPKGNQGKEGHRTMSIIKTYQSKFFGGHLNIEMYNSAQEVADDLERRERTSPQFEDTFRAGRTSFIGATKEQAYDMLRNGYQPIVDALKTKMRISASGQKKRFKTFNDVAGFQPIIPNAIMGLPNSMINSAMRPIKTKVLDIYYEMTVPAYRDSAELIKAGQKMLGVILELEAQGYRFNLYCTQGYYNERQGCDMLCVKVKSANQPMDLKRMSFPIAHTAFFRGIGFDWYSKFPKGTYRHGYGHAISCDKSQSEIQEEYRKLFGKNVIYFSAETVCKKRDEAEEYLKEVLTK